MVEGHRTSFYHDVETPYLPDHREGYHEQWYRNNEAVYQHAECFSDHDCEPGYVCEVTDSWNHVSQCLQLSHTYLKNYPTEDYGSTYQAHHHHHPYAQIEDGQERNTERGHFELGYWCLKDTDCESKHCAQVGPRLYDKECQGPDYVDFKKPEKKKRAHHRREPAAPVHDVEEVKEEAKPHDEF